jgi:hypothetical protein
MEILYLKRNVDEILLTWSREKPPDIKPLLLRGVKAGKEVFVYQAFRKAVQILCRDKL